MTGMVRVQGAVAFVLLIFSIVTLNPAQARVYRWVDEKGQVHYSDRVPQKYADKERKEYDGEGRLISTIEAAKTKEQLAAEKKKSADEAQRRKAAEEQEKADRALLTTYANTQELEKAREEQLAMIDAAIEDLEEKLKGLNESATHSKQDEAKGETDKSQQNSAVSEIQRQLEIQRKKKSETQQRFDSYSQRLAELNR